MGASAGNGSPRGGPSVVPSRHRRAGRWVGDEALELLRVTEAGADAAGRWVGLGDGEAGDAAAATRMSRMLEALAPRGTRVIGGSRGATGRPRQRDPAPENGADGAWDVAVRAVDGGSAVADHLPDVVTAIAASPRGTMYDPTPVSYMDKVATGPRYAAVVDIGRPVAENLAAVARVKGTRVSGVTVAVLDLPRHRDLVEAVRATGAIVHLVRGGDVASAVATARPDSAVDVLLGVGSAQGGVVAAAALSCLGGSLQARLWPRDEEERDTALDRGHDLHRVLREHDLVEDVDIAVCLTGVTRGVLLDGVTSRAGRVRTQSLVLSPGTVRLVRGEGHEKGTDDAH